MADGAKPLWNRAEAANPLRNGLSHASRLIICQSVVIIALGIALFGVYWDRPHGTTRTMELAGILGLALGWLGSSCAAVLRFRRAIAASDAAAQAAPQ